MVSLYTSKNVLVGVYSGGVLGRSGEGAAIRATSYLRIHLKKKCGEQVIFIASADNDVVLCLALFSLCCLLFRNDIGIDCEPNH
jgi:hypothetical protein